MSRSLTLSARRRADPASSHVRARAPRARRRPATSSSPSSSARVRSTRLERPSGRSRRSCSAASMLASNFGPSPLTALQALVARPRPRAPRASRSPARRTSGGPAWGRGRAAVVSSISPAGNFARSLTAAGISPVSAGPGSSPEASCRSLGARSPGPRRPSPRPRRMPRGRPWRRSGRRRTRWTIAPSSSYRSPSSSSASAIVPLDGGEAATRTSLGPGGAAHPASGPHDPRHALGYAEPCVASPG